MKLVNPELSKQIEFQNAKAYEWIIESPKLFLKYVQELLGQAEGKVGNFVLSHKDKELDIQKYVEVIVNPFGIDLNDRRVIKKLYTDLVQLAYSEEFFLETQELKGHLQNFIYHLEQDYEYALDADIEVDISGIFKAMNVKLENDAENLLENIGQYVKVLSGVLKKKLIAFVNIGSYIDKAQKEELIKMGIYNEIEILFMENVQRDFSKNCLYYIIDKDECEIY